MLLPCAQTKVHGTTLTLSSQKPTRNGYDFTYWTTNADGTGTKYYPGAQYTANAGVTFYAQWIQTYNFNVDFRLDGKPVDTLNNIGSFDVYLNGQQYENDVTDYARRPHKGTTYEIKDIKAKDGYRYDGVYSGSLTGTFGSDTTVVLSFSTRKYTVTYYVGASVFDKQTKSYGQAMMIGSKEPTRDGYTFAGWNTKADGSGTNYHSGALYTANADLNLYAQWKSTLTITTQPTDKTVDLGDPVTVSLKAQGTGLTYQWYFKKMGQTSFSKWNGRTHASETVTPNVSWNGIELYCVVKDKEDHSVTSKTITVTVTQKLKITTQPTDKIVELGDPVTVSLKAQGTGLTYQWYYKKAGQTSYSKWNGRTHASEVVTPNASWNGIQLYCVVKDNTGKSVSSDTAKITVIQELKITTQPTSKTVTLGEPVTVSLKAHGTGLTYQWYFKKAGQSSFNKWNGRTHASETVTPNATWNAIKLYCIVKDASGNAENSNIITITVKIPAITITQQPKNVTASVGEDVAFIVKASGTGVTYQWQYKKAGQTSWKNWGTRTTATTIATSNATWNGMQVRCIIKDSKGNSVTSSAATITIK